MSDAPTTENPILALLATLEAHDLVGGIRVPTAGQVPIAVEYGQGKPGSGRISGAMVPLIIGAVLILVSLIATISLLRSDAGLGLENGMAIGLPLFIAAFIAGPAVVKAQKGTLQWRRQALIHSDRVEVRDITSKGDFTWSAPISEYVTIDHGFVFVSARDGDGGGADIERVALRHADPAKSIYVSGTRKTVMGGMSFSDMVAAGREGRKADVEAAVGDTRNPEVEQLVSDLANLTGLPVTQDFK